MRKYPLFILIIGLAFVIGGLVMVIKGAESAGWLLVMPGIPIFFTGLASLTTSTHKTP